jgi:nucleoside-diphosphate-sugar epimerase
MRSIRNCSVCVVGGAGFLGSHLVDYLINERNCSVLVLDNLITGRRDFLHPAAKFEYADITGSESYLRKLFQLHEVGYVFNYAAEPYIPVSFSRPLHVFGTNATGAMNVINAAQDAGCSGILQVSSAEIYGNCVGGKLNEEYPVNPHSTYGVAKAAIDFWIQARWKEAWTPAIALRQFNCIGERETHPYVVTTIISQIYQRVLEGRSTPTIDLGNNSFRDFQYAGDAVRMTVELLEKGEFGQVYNMGAEDGTKIYDLAQLIGRLMGYDSVQINVDPRRVRPWEIWSLCSDNSKLYATIECRPQVPFEEALKKTIKYFQDNGARWVWEC